MKQILKDAFKSSELQYSLEDVIAVDDKIDVEDIPNSEIIKEAKYVLGKFTGASVGFEQEDDYNGHNGEEQQEWARREVAALQRLLKKYDDSGVRRAIVSTKSFAPGVVICYKSINYKLEKPAGPRRGWIAKREQDGKAFRLKCKQLTSATVAR